jgi:hypothetical protein
MRKNGITNMQIPKKIKIGGRLYSIFIVSEDDFDDKSAGEIATDKGWIKIVQGQKSFIEQTLLHELFHAINTQLSEETIEFLAQAWYQIMIDNPGIFRGGEAKHG